MITICARWESSQMPAELEWRMWRQLRGAFKISRFVFVPKDCTMDRVRMDQYDTMEEALATCQGHLAFLEPDGDKLLTELPSSGDLTLILGNTQTGNLPLASLALRASHDSGSYRIHTPGRTDLYGLNAAAIALAFHCGQSA